MLRFSEKIYTYGIEDPKAEIGLLSAGKYSAHIYIVCLEEKTGFVTLINTVFLRMNRNADMDYTVIGLASGYHFGLKLIRRMTADCLAATGSASVKEHIPELCGGVR